MSEFGSDPETAEDDPMHDLELLNLLDDLKMRIGDERTTFDTPPADLWQGIQRQISTDLEGDQGRSPALPQSESVVTSLDHHRRRRRPAGMLLAAVAASVVAAVAVGSIVRNGSTVVGEVQLATLTQSGVPSLGTATIVEDNGVTRLDITFDTGLVGADDTYELWIIDNQIDQMYSLGEIGSTGEGDQRTYEIPEGVDIKDFPIVDVSLEPDDGNPDHSGDSHFRGVLDA
jgi:hypothetical protein